MTLKQALNSATKRLQVVVAESLDMDVAPVIKDQEAQMVREVVYDSYLPKVYRRRGGNYYGGNASETYGPGLGSTDSMTHEVSGLTLRVRNDAPPNPGGGPDYNSDFSVNKNLAELVEFGHGNPWMYDYARRNPEYLKPRPFTHETFLRLKTNKRHVEALKSSIRKEWLNCEVR